MYLYSYRKCHKMVCVLYVCIAAFFPRKIQLVALLVARSITTKSRFGIKGRQCKPKPKGASGVCSTPQPFLAFPKRARAMQDWMMTIELWWKTDRVMKRQLLIWRACCHLFRACCIFASLKLYYIDEGEFFNQIWESLAEIYNHNLWGEFF